MFERIDRYMTIIGREIVASVIEGFASAAACECPALDDQPPPGRRERAVPASPDRRPN